MTVIVALLVVANTGPVVPAYEVDNLFEGILATFTGHGRPVGDAVLDSLQRSDERGVARGEGLQIGRRHEHAQGTQRDAGQARGGIDALELARRVVARPDRAAVERHRHQAAAESDQGARKLTAN